MFYLFFFCLSIVKWKKSRFLWCTKSWWLRLTATLSPKKKHGVQARLQKWERTKKIHFHDRIKPMDSMCLVFSSFLFHLDIQHACICIFAETQTLWLFLLLSLSLSLSFLFMFFLFFFWLTFWKSKCILHILF